VPMKVVECDCAWLIVYMVPTCPMCDGVQESTDFLASYAYHWAFCRRGALVKEVSRPGDLNSASLVIRRLLNHIGRTPVGSSKLISVLILMLCM
jgi:hypothetical protein